MAFANKLCERRVFPCEVMDFSCRELASCSRSIKQLASQLPVAGIYGR
jgi:hypothetical protein